MASGAFAYNDVDGRLYVGKGDNGSGGATSMPAIGGENPAPLHISTKQVSETVVSVSPSANVVTVDLSAGTVFDVTLNANVSSFTISNPIASRVNSFTVYMNQDATGSRTVTWSFTGKTIKWAAGLSPTITATANKTDVITFVSKDGGSTWFGFVGGQNY